MVLFPGDEPQVPKLTVMQSCVEKPFFVVVVFKVPACCVF